MEQSPHFIQLTCNYLSLYWVLDKKNENIIVIKNATLNDRVRADHNAK